MIGIQELLADHQEFHSDLQMDSFITIRSGGTAYGCYRQSLRELTTRVTALRERYYGLELLELEIREHEKSGGERDKILARQKRSVLPQAAAVLADTEREFVYFYAQAAGYRALLERDGVRFPLDTETRDKLDREMWVHQLKCRAAVEGFSQGRPASVTVELIQSLPQEMRRTICEEVFAPGAPDKLLDWFLTFEAPEPARISLPEIEPRKLIGCSE